MTSVRKSQTIKKNRLLALLPQPEHSRLIPALKPVTLKKKEVLYQAGDRVRYCYFPTSGIISLMSTASEGKTVEVGMVGSEWSAMKE